jgi:hypothetical protein
VAARLDTDFKRVYFLAGVSTFWLSAPARINERVFHENSPLKLSDFNKKWSVPINFNKIIHTKFHENPYRYS